MSEVFKSHEPINSTGLENNPDVNKINNKKEDDAVIIKEQGDLAIRNRERVAQEIKFDELLVNFKWYDGIDTFIWDVKNSPDSEFKSSVLWVFEKWNQDTLASIETFLIMYMLWEYSFKDFKKSFITSSFI